MRVSVVICTLNRAQGLRDTLACLRRQNYADFEVVVVNGPSTDGTDVVLAEHSGAIRSVSCPAPNLSMSRNIGIRASAGDIVAFIDDDALPEFDWLEQAVRAFDDPEVGGCGGIVFDHTGMALQYRYSAANRFGEPTWSHAYPFDELSVPSAFTFPYLQGTNALFRRSVLERVGGFDETYEYYLDETDLCCRVVDAGYVLRQLDDAPVHHKFLPSGIRDHQRVVTNWFPLVKNHTYFGFRHALEEFGEQAVLDNAEAFLQSRVEDAAFHESAGRLPAGSAARAARIGEEAIARGAELGLARSGLALGPVHWPQPEFSPYPALADRTRRRYVLVSAGYGDNMTGGVARYTTDLAQGLAREGVEVRVITTSAGHSTVDLEGGVWVHRLQPSHAGEGGVEPGASDSINDFATAVASEVERIGQWAPIDVVYGALWDVELLGVLRRTALPTMVHLVTPAAVAAAQAGFMDHEDSRRFIETLMSLEREVLADADLLHANGNPIIQTIDHFYGSDERDPGRCQVVPLGLRDLTPPTIDDITAEPAAADAPIDVLFVGRLEARKGIDLFLAVVEALAAKYPQVSWHVVGVDLPLRPGEVPVGAAFRAAHANEPWLQRVHFAGAVTDDELHDFYARSGLVVLPSRYESFGLVMLEAMMHGKALVSSDVGGIVEVVRRDIDGLLVPPGDADALIAAVSDLLGDPVRRHELGRTARQRYLDFFAMEPATSRFLAAADRLHFHAPGAVAVTLDPGATQRRGPSGRDEVTIAGTETCELQLDAGSRWRVMISADAPTVVVIEDAEGARAHRVSASRVHRIDVAAGRISIRTAGHPATVHGVVGLRGSLP